MYDVILGCIVAFAYAYLMYPKISKKHTRIKASFKNILYKGSIIIPISKKKAAHIHHWIIFLLLLLYCFILNKNIPLGVFSFSICLILQGLCYNDCFNIICKNPYQLDMVR